MSRLNAAGSSITDIIRVMPRANLVGGEIPEWPFPMLGAETFGAGTAVCLSGSAGNAVGITQMGIDGSGYGILGFAADNASGVSQPFSTAGTGAASGRRGVWVALPNSVFVGNVGNSNTSASAQTAATDIGQQYGLTTSGNWTYVDKYKTTPLTNTMVRVIGFHEQDAVPTFYGRVYFTVLQEVMQFNRGAIIVSSPFARLP
jgi:hypothetical protein